MVNFAGQMSSSLKRHEEMLTGFHEESDWAFIIKSHALFEASLNQAVLHVLGDDRIKRFTEKLSVSYKVRLARDLGVLDESQVEFIKYFSEIRNKLVHNVNNVNFDLKEHVASLPRTKAKEFASAIVWKKKDEEVTKIWLTRVHDSPKLVILVFMFMLLTLLQLKALEASGHRKIAQLSSETADEFFERFNQ